MAQKKPPAAPKMHHEVAGEKVAHFLREYGRIILIAIGVIFAASLAFVIYRVIIEEQAERANETFEEGLQAYSLLQQMPDQAQQMQQLGVAVEKFTEASEQAPGSVVAHRANFYMGNAYFTMRDMSSAIQYFRRVANTRSYLAAPATLFLMKSYSEVQEYDQAITAFNEFRRKHNKSYLMGEATLTASRLYRANGNNEQALSVLRAYVEERDEDDPYREQIIQRIALIETQVL